MGTTRCAFALHFSYLTVSKESGSLFFMHPYLFCMLALARHIVAISNFTPVVDIGYAQYQGSYDFGTNMTWDSLRPVTHW